MKILVIVQRFDGGGVTRVALKLGEAFKVLGKEVSFISSSCREYNKIGPCAALHNLTYIKPYNVLTLYNIVSKPICDAIRSEQPNVVVAHTGWFAAPLIGCDIKIPMLIVVHGTYVNELKYIKHHPIYGLERLRYEVGIKLSHLNEVLALRTLQKRDNVFIVAVSKKTKEELIQLGIRETKLYSILNGVDKNIFKPIDKDIARTCIQKKLGEAEIIAENAKILLHVNPGPIKGTHILIKSIALLRKMLRDRIVLLVVGNIGSSTYRGYIEKLVEEMGLEDTIKFVEWVPNEELPCFYSAADLAIVSSYSEGAPLVIPESLACGTPVVATNVGGNPEYLRLTLPNAEEYLVEIQDYDFSKTLARKIAKALNYRVKPNIEYVPSWFDIARQYLRLVEYLG